MSDTYQGILASTNARRGEAMEALSFLRQVEQLAEAVRSLEPDGKVMAMAVSEAREDAVQAVCLWRTARREAFRAAQTAQLRRAGGALR